MYANRRFACTLAILPVLLCLLPAAALASVDQPALSIASSETGTALGLNDVVFHETQREVLNERVVGVPDSDAFIVLWDEAAASGSTSSYYAISLNGSDIAAVRETSYDIKLRHGEFDPARGELPVAGEFSAAGDVNLYIVQFVTQPLEIYRSQIEALGGKVRHFLPYNANIVEMPPAVREAVAGLPYVRWVGVYQPAYRLEEFARENADRAQDVYPWQRYNIQVFESGLRQKHAVADRIKALGGEINSPNAGKYLLEATLTPGLLFEVVRWDEVLFVDRWSPLEPDMNNARAFGGANYIETVAGYRGQGVRGEVFDTGFNLTHVDLQHHPAIIHNQTNVDSHGASTLGICFGDGTGNANARGLLPEGQPIVAYYSGIMEGPGNPTPRYIHTGELIQDPYYAVFQTSSVGSARTFFYTTISADTDAALFDFDILHCQSQSNAGNQDSRPQAWAKNIISGGAANHYDTFDPSDDCWCFGGSTGPAQDGRIKPDLCGYYDDILTTTTGSNTAYTSTFGGTSGATPIIAGHTGLFFQMWSEGIFGNEVTPGGTVFENKAHMSTAKAMMINTANPYPFTGQAHDLTRTHQGWGWPDLQFMYDMREKMFIVNEDRILENLETATYPLSVLPDEPELRVTMVYPDPPGNPSATLHRINDLSLKVTSPTGTEYFGNVGLRDGNWSTSGGSMNDFDTVENVFIQNPQSGVWVVEVSAQEIVQDGHVETGGLDADFALVVSGVTPCSSAGSVGLNGTAYQCEDSAELRVVDCDLNLDPNAIETVQITISSDSEPAGETLVLTETAEGSAVFFGTIGISETDGAGILLVADGDAVTATYIDADDGLGGTNVVVTDTAVVDCGAPAISNVQATDLTARTANITFDADEPVSATVYYGTACGALNNTASSPALELSPVIALSSLTDNTTYFYAVEGQDAAGNATYDDNGGSCYTFTTPDVPDYFTEQFTSNDLDNLSLTFSPDGSSDYYDGCAETIAALPTDPTGGTIISLSDDSYSLRSLTGGQTVSLYGQSYSSFYVGSNGYITFNTGDTTYSETLSVHFSQPRISGLFDDLNPSTGGTVSWKQLSDRAAVTWLNVPEYGTSNANTFQIEMFFNGDIVISYLNIDAADGIAGLSEGNGLDPEFLSSDLSAMGSCLCLGDLDGDGDVDLGDLSILLSNYPTANGAQYSDGDLDGDGDVDLGDLAILLSAYANPC